jgi:cytoskeleton protein RodZ
VNEVAAEAVAETSPVRPGARLAAAREAGGLTVADVARQLKLSSWQIEALEQDNYARLPGAVFVRGFIKNYARLVKIDPASLLDVPEDRISTQSRPVPELPPSADIPFPSGYRFPWQKYAIAGLVLLVPVVIFEFYRDDVAEVAVKSRHVALPPPVASEVKIEPTPPAVVTPAADVASAPAPAMAVPETVIPSKKSEPSTSPLSSSRVAAVEHKPGEHIVKLKFERESWVEIRDRSGHKIFSQLNPAGTEQAVSGQPPLSLVVGNAVVYSSFITISPSISRPIPRSTLRG